MLKAKHYRKPGTDASGPLSPPDFSALRLTDFTRRDNVLAVSVIYLPRSLSRWRKLAALFVVGHDAVEALSQGTLLQSKTISRFAGNNGVGRQPRRASPPSSPEEGGWQGPRLPEA